MEPHCGEINIRSWWFPYASVNMLPPKRSWHTSHFCTTYMKNSNSNHLHLMITTSAFLHVSPSYVDKYACLLLCTRSIIYPHPTKAIHNPPLILVEDTYHDISHSFWQASSNHLQAYFPENSFRSIWLSTTTWGWTSGNWWYSDKYL